MAGTKKQITGKANEAVGTLRKKAGELVGNPKLAAKGARQQRKGKAQGIVGKTREKLSVPGVDDRIKGKADEAVGAVRKKAGQLVGNPKLTAKGTGQQARGKAEGIVGKAKGKLS
jgi:uncharacterized protein YjbJ (UPF0337 family)